MNMAGSLRTERLTLAVLMCGVASLALSDFVSPLYWSLSVVAGLFRLWRGPGFSLSELQVSMIGWFGFFWVGLELVLGRAWIVAFTDFLLILALAVVIEAPTARNHLHRMLIGVFLVLAAAVLTDSVLYVLPLAALIWFLWRAAACLYGLNWPNGDLDPLPARRDIKPMLMIVAMAAVLFIAMPRLDVHSMLKPTQPRMQTSGFSDQVQLGDFARELDATVVLRVEPEAPLQDADLRHFRSIMAGRYWRGTPLSRFTGQGWQRLSSGAARNNIMRSWARGSDVRLAKGKGVRAAVYREASDHGYIQLPEGLLGIHAVPESVRLDAGGSMSFMTPPARRLRLLMDISSGRWSAADSDMRPPVAAEYSTADTPVALKQWVTEFGSEGSPADVLQRIARELSGWTYDLHADISDEHPLASFLSGKRGHCELFATTLALAARELGLPARVVNGYRSGEWNKAGGFLIVRQQHAHSWTEVWMDGAWRLMDATPASRWSLSGVRFPALDEVWEAVRLNWYRYVLEFQDADRTALIRQLWQQLRRYGLMLALFVVAIGLMLWLGGYLRRLSLHKRRLPGWPVLDRWLQRHGRYRAPYQPLRQVPAPEGVDIRRWQAFVSAWEAQAYGGTKAWRRRELRRHLRAL